MTQRMNVTLLGHKDHGKSTLIGRLLYDTKTVKEDRIEEVRETCRALEKPFEYAFLLDSFQEEREGGMTIDVIHAQIKGKCWLYDCIDVPGHKELIKNMLTGASQAEAGILIVSAKEGVEEQTGHHLRLAQWLELGQLIVVINKMDLVGFQQDIFEGMRQRITGLGEAGLDEKVSYIPVSAYEGDNVVMRSSRMPWYTGYTLYEHMEILSKGNQLSQRPLRLPVQDFYRGANGEQIIAGRIESGSLRVGQMVFFASSVGTSRVKSILTFNDKAEAALAGENVGMVCDPELPSLKRGEVCCSQDEIATAKKELLAHAIFLESAPRQSTVECGTAQTDCEIEYFSPVVPGEVTRVSFRFNTPLVVECSRTALGRLALKRQGKIIGVAVAI